MPRQITHRYTLLPYPQEGNLITPPASLTLLLLRSSIHRRISRFARVCTLDRGRQRADIPSLVMNGLDIMLMLMLTIARPNRFRRRHGRDSRDVGYGSIHTGPGFMIICIFLAGSADDDFPAAPSSLVVVVVLGMLMLWTVVFKFQSGV